MLYFVNANTREKCAVAVHHIMHVQVERGKTIVYLSHGAPLLVQETLAQVVEAVVGWRALKEALLP